jgi:excisionase family DNA binding protein
MEPDPYHVLGEALGAIVRQALREALSEMATPGNAECATAVSVTAAAARLGLSVSKTKRRIASGELPSFVVGRRRLVPTTDINNYIQRLINHLH